MNFTRIDIVLLVIVLILTVLDYLYQITTAIKGFDIVLLLSIFAIYLVWSSILIFNLSSIAIDYAYPDEMYIASGMRTKKLYRTIILTSSVLILLIVTLSFIGVIPGILGLMVSINLLALRAAFLLLGPDENPYYSLSSSSPH